MIIIRFQIKSDPTSIESVLYHWSKLSMASASTRFVYIQPNEDRESYTLTIPYLCMMIPLRFRIKYIIYFAHALSIDNLQICLVQYRHLFFWVVLHPSTLITKYFASSYKNIFVYVLDLSNHLCIILHTQLWLWTQQLVLLNNMDLK